MPGTTKTFIAIVLFLIVIYPIQTQENTPTETLEAPQSFPDTTIAEAFNQDDLSILVGNVQRPNGITWFNGDLYTACNGDWTLYQIDDTTGETQTFIFGVQDVHSLYMEETEEGFNIWAPDFATNQITLITQDRSNPDPVSDSIEGPWGITTFDEETFLVTSLKDNSIIQVNKSGESNPYLDGLRSPAGITRDDKFVYVANNGSARRAIEWFDPSEEEPELQSLVNGLQNTSNLVLAPDGLLYFTYALGTRGVVGRVDPEVCREDGCINEDVEIVLFTELPAPLAGLAFSDDMRLFVHAIYRPEIYWVSLYGTEDTSTEGANS
ncbi:hypothetical protein G4Y79_15980 [Phototrophicus methaneseepsis]|uniref:SMP-30/Gluconolactonase/LRE-like region domain-containing protein n=1 Tax=Phototrophicus methaneseepsis TaxID=2710758 RepID=A0A7S8E6C8_9CHLR|nr:hypothetical protein [Phototrophicus methaneseepsis]QPC81201.1 hypothetical protein G4Y79_15980 [Phototrophicus methaneseepsis]